LLAGLWTLDKRFDIGGQLDLFNPDIGQQKRTRDARIRHDIREGPWSPVLRPDLLDTKSPLVRLIAHEIGCTRETALRWLDRWRPDIPMKGDRAPRPDSHNWPS
jgi:hypothetical protein